MSCSLRTLRGLTRLIIVTSVVLISAALKAEVIAQLPTPISNNAVAAAKVDEQWLLYSFNGLGEGKDWQSVSNAAMGYQLSSNKSFEIGNVPFTQGRLASVAATVNNKIYLFGGYTVASDHQEKSIADVYQFDPQSKKFSLFSHIPIAVDDSVALVYQQRYIYLISGWHDVGNVNNVQVLDTFTKKWFEATSFPGDAVFGHAAGIIDNQMVIADGVKVAAVVDGKRKYQMSGATYQGTINPTDVSKIDWQILPSHPGKAKYRMAAAGVVKKELIIFAGGSENPYNFDGIGYNGEPSQPSNEVFGWDVHNRKWFQLPALSQASMDHRGLILADDYLFIIGGMHRDQKVTRNIVKYSIE